MYTYKTVYIRTKLYAYVQNCMHTYKTVCIRTKLYAYIQNCIHTNPEDGGPDDFIILCLFPNEARKQ